MISSNEEEDQVVLYLLTLLTDIIVFAAEVVHEDPIPEHNSILTGQLFVQELMDSNNLARFRLYARMDKHNFITLVNFMKIQCHLQDSRYINVEQKILILIHVLCGHTLRFVADRFQHSLSTISLIIHEVADYFTENQILFYRRPELGAPTPEYIIEKNEFYPYFSDCIGAVDGTHVPAVVLPELHPRFRDRQQNISQNVLAVVDFDLIFEYCLYGWEGSAHDSRIFTSAQTQGLPILPNKYYVGDAGFALSSICLTPYRGVRYHLHEWGAVNQRPENARELFNLRHSKLRNVIERVFGVIKKRFPILYHMQSFPYTFQVQLVMCCFLLHNFIRLEDLYEDDYYFRIYDNEQNHLGVQPVFIDIEAEIAAAAAELAAPNAAELNAWRDGIANAMWIQYQEMLHK